MQKKLQNSERHLASQTSFVPRPRFFACLGVLCVCAVSLLHPGFFSPGSISLKYPQENIPVECPSENSIRIA